MNDPATTGGRRWDGSRYGHPTQRLLRLAPDTRTRALRAPQTKPCTACGNRVEWYPRHGATAVPLHPHELPITDVPEFMRWHVDQGIARPYADGSPWCRIPHLPLCPARTAQTTTRLGRLDALRRRLAVHTRRLIDTGRLTPADDRDSSADIPYVAEPGRDVVYLLHLLYLAPGPIGQVRCIAQTRHRARCRHLLADHEDVPDVAVAVPPAPGRGHLTGHLTDTLMLVRDLTWLTYADQLRWRHQHCPAHACGSAADVVLPEWEPFDAFAHHQHIRHDTTSTGLEGPGEWHGD